MAEDGIYELTGLRVGWVGIFTSVIAGGAFALIIYFIVMAGLLDAAYPHVNDQSPVAVAAQVVETDVVAEASQPASETATGEAAKADAATPPPLTIQPELRPDCPNSSDPRCTSVGNQMARALGLLDRMSFFKMLILAFLAGFAERLVPDILSRLSKRQQGA